MTRFLPAQLKLWTKGELFQTGAHAADPERYYPFISTDTRTLAPGEVFVPLRGDHFDGHDFLDEAIDKNAGMIVCERCAAALSDILERLRHDNAAPDVLVVDDTWQAYQDMAKGFRAVINANVIGVTGSVGKTTTRRMIYQMITTQVKAEQSERNFNNQVGLPRTILSTCPETDVLVAELAMDRRGEISKLTKIAVPDIGIVTGIGMSHAEHVGSMTDILDEKISIVEGIKDNGILIVNGDDPLLESWVMEHHNRISVWYVASEHNVGRLERDGVPVFWAEHVHVDREDGLSFIGRSNLAPDERWPIFIPYPGVHLVHAALFGLASAYILGLNMQEAAMGAKRFVMTESRQEWFRLPDIDILNDAYNAAPESLGAALRTTQLLAGSRRILAVIGGMRELGQYSRRAHQDAASDIRDAGVDSVFLVGSETEATRDALLEDEATRDRFSGWFESSAQALPFILKELSPGDFLLIKGSRYYGLEHILDEVYKVWGSH